MNPNEEEDENKPSVDSNDPAERIKARRLRIEERKEAKRRAKIGEDRPDEESEIVEELSVSRKQIETSYVRLKKLNDDGFELVTNIRVAGDARELKRRLEEEEATRHRKEKLEAEAKAGGEKFEDISKKWEVAIQKELAHDLHDMLMTQKAACDAMLDEKNKIINDYNIDLKAKDDQYVRDLKKEMEDIDLLIERINNLVEELRKAYRLELDEIERAFVNERATLLEKQNAKINQMMSERRQKELDYMKNREQLVAESEQMLHDQRVQDAEEYNQVKVKLETDVQLLQQQLQQMKATYQLNQEKLEYNFQVLKKRDEENMITKSQQKRKITRLHDIQTNLKAKLEKQEKLYQDDNQQLTDDYKRITEQYLDLQKKSKHFMSIDDRRYREVWIMKEEECKALVKKLLLADRAIYEQQMGLQWTQPKLEFMKNVGPLRQKPKTTREAHDLAQKILKTSITTGQVFSQKDYELMKQQGMTDKEIRSIEERNEGMIQKSAGVIKLEAEADAGKFPSKLVKQILELLCDESGFLLETKLRTLLEPLERCEQTLMKLDAIFNVLGIETEEDIQNLSRYFIRYAKELDSDDQKHLDQEEDAEVEVVQKLTDISEFVGEGDEVEIAAKDLSLEAPNESEVKASPSQYSIKVSADEDPTQMPDTEGPQLIHPNSVLKALRAFVEDYNKSMKKKEVSAPSPGPLALGDLPSSEVIISATGEEEERKKPRTVEEVLRKYNLDRIVEQFVLANETEYDETGNAAYWAMFPAVISKDREKVWTALLDSFEKYYDVLTQRSKLTEETDVLRQQNTELRMLLHQYVNSKVNQELEIPPTRTLQLQYVAPM